MFNGIRSFLGMETKTAPSLSEIEALLSGAATTSSGISVSPETAMRCSPAFACIRIIGETVEQVPLHLYRRLPDGGRERVTDHPAARVLRQPNEFTTSAEAKLLLGMHLATHGNALIWIGKDSDGNPVEAISLDPRWVSVKRNPMTLAPIYTVTVSGVQREHDRSEIVHVRGPGLDTLVGASPVALARDAINLSMNIESHCNSLWISGAKPSGILKIKGKKTEEAFRRIRASFSQFYHGNAGKKTLILDEDTDFQQVQLNSVDSQTLEMRRFQIAEISRYWRIPLSMLSELCSITHANSESLGQQFLTFCMLPIFRSITDAMALTLLRPDERDDYFFDFLVDDLARADLVNRMQAYSQAIAHGIYNPNELRAMDNRSGYVGGDTYTRPVNVAPVAPTAASTTEAANGTA